MNQIEKNTVKADNQLDTSKYISFEGEGRLKIMIAGNSITRHGVLKEIGWDNDFGMAASSKDKDFAHILMKKVSEVTDATFCINQVSRWEQNYKNGEKVFADYQSSRDFDADIIIVRFIENCAHGDFESDVFVKKFEEFMNFLNKSGKAKVIVTTGFWKHPGNADLKKYAEKYGYPLVELEDLGEDDDMKAIGLFEHEGVANHPGDLGMENIAERIWAELKKMI